MLASFYAKFRTSCIWNNSLVIYLLDFSQSAFMQAIDEIVPTLLRANEDDETSDTALEGLQNILRFLLI